MMRTAIIVAHGAPSAPDGPEAVLSRLARSVARAAPDLNVMSATLAGPVSLLAALRCAGPDPLIYPFFMSDGWFVTTELRRRIAEDAPEGTTPDYLPPFGFDDGLPALCRDVLLEAAAAHDLDPASSSAMIAAHGHPRIPRAGLAARAVAEKIAALGPFRDVPVGFVDEPPSIAEAAEGRAGLCLPLFAMRASHVNEDIPEGLAEAHFGGHLLPAIGEHTKVGAMIAASLNARASFDSADVTATDSALG